MHWGAILVLYSQGARNAAAVQWGNTHNIVAAMVGCDFNPPWVEPQLFSGSVPEPQIDGNISLTLPAFISSRMTLRNHRPCAEGCADTSVNGSFVVPMQYKYAQSNIRSWCSLEQEFGDGHQEDV